MTVRPCGSLFNRRIIKYGVALLTVGLAVGGFTSRDERGSDQVEIADRTRSSSLVIEKTSGPVRVGSTGYEDEGESRLAKAIDRGQALRLQLPGREPLDFSFRDFLLLADGYRTTIGQADRLDAELRVFEGRAIGDDGQVHTATLALANRSVAGVVRLANGGQVQLRGADDGSYEALTGSPPELACVRDPRTGSYRTMPSGAG